MKQAQAVDHAKEPQAWQVLEAYWRGELQKDQAEYKLAQIRATVGSKYHGKSK